MQFNMVQKDKEKIDLLIEKESELQYQKAQEQYIYPKGVVNVDDYNMFKEKKTHAYLFVS